MKGIIFNEFFEHVEAKYGYEVTDRLVEKVNPIQEGEYQPEVSYDDEELKKLLNLLSQEVGCSVPSLMIKFGEHLFSRFLILYRPDFAGRTDVFEFLEKMDGYIHNHIQSIFPDAKLPHITTRRINYHKLELMYRSKIGFSNLAVGMIKGCQRYFNEDLVLETEFLSTDGSIVRFTLSKN